jgi:Cft2 family RNA processing exonuclease
LKDSAKIGEDGYDEDYRKYAKLIRDAQGAIRIVRNADSKGIPKNKRNGDRMKGTGELDPSLGEGKDGVKIKNRIHGGKAIHDLPESKIQQSRQLLSELGFYDLETSSFINGASIKKNIPAPKKNLYDLKDVNKVEYFVQTHKYDEKFELEPGIEATFYNAGHIAGSAMVVLKFKVDDQSTYNVMFSGDLGRLRGDFHPYGKPRLPPEVPIDAFVHETTYGGKVHWEREFAIDDLGRVIREAYMKRKKALIIPTFAIERCASLLHALIELKKQEYFDGEIILDSPLGIQQTMVAGRHAEDEAFSENLMNKHAYRVAKGEDREGLERSKKFRIIVTGSGMANGGPILDYLKLYSNNPDIEFAFAGYQSEGTIGNELTSGYKSITIDGLKLHVEAKVNNLMGFSAHADERDLFEIMEYGSRSRRHGERHRNAKLLLVHGERDKSTTAYVNYLKRRVREGKRGVPKMENVFLPNLEETLVLYSAAGKEVEKKEE